MVEAQPCRSLDRLTLHNEGLPDELRGPISRDEATASHYQFPSDDALPSHKHHKVGWFSCNSLQTNLDTRGGDNTMSGIEIAGVALALLPLLISAAENYDRCAAPFSRFKNFPKEAKRFLQGIDIQKVIFHNQCRILLENVVDQDVAAIMIQTAEHHFWHDIELEARLAQILEQSRGACITTIELIGKCLKAVESDCQNLSAGLAESKHVGVVSKSPPASFRRPAEFKPSFAKGSKRRRKACSRKKKPYCNEVAL